MIRIIPLNKMIPLLEGGGGDAGLRYLAHGLLLYTSLQCDDVCVTNLGGNMARFTQFPLMITRSTIIYEIISPGAAGSSIYV